jgi:YHS domain-containing protein
MNHQHDDKIACQVCKKEIPKSAALNAEGAEYVQYFCNTDCLDYWKKEKEESEDKKD